MVCHKKPQSTYEAMDGLRRSVWPFNMRHGPGVFMASLRFMSQVTVPQKALVPF
jgi:hypothetical protein